MDRDINSVIMDYLVKEGYPDSAKKFASEANIKQRATDDESMRARVEIKNAIHSGQIQTAIEKVNELNPEVRVAILVCLLLYDYICFMHHS
jgi:hypothetical protein